MQGRLQADERAYVSATSDSFCDILSRQQLYLELPLEQVHYHALVAHQVQAP